MVCGWDVSTLTAVFLDAGMTLASPPLTLSPLDIPEWVLRSLELGLLLPQHTRCSGPGL